jgi:hypothetical protein
MYEDDIHVKTTSTTIIQCYIRQENEGVAKHSFCRGKVGLIMRSGSVGKEEPGKMGYPVRRGTSGCE